MSEDDLNTIQVLNKIQNSAQELLAYSWKVDSKAQRLLKIYEDAAKLRNKIQVQKQRQEPSIQKELEQTITDLEGQKQELPKWQAALDKSLQGVAKYEPQIIESISTLFASIYDIKQLEYTMKSNQNTVEMVKMLKNILNELKKQLRTEQQKMDEGNKQIYAKQHRIISSIHEDIIKKVGQKKKQSQKLEIETETISVFESAKMEEYDDTLSAMNERKIERILSFQEDTSLFAENANNENKVEAPKTSQEPKTELKFEVVKLEASYHYEKMTGIGLFIFSLFLVAIFLLR